MHAVGLHLHGAAESKATESEGNTRARVASRCWSFTGTLLIRDDVNLCVCQNCKLYIEVQFTVHNYTSIQSN